MKFITYSAGETQQVAKNLAQQYHQGGIMALFGELGTGKTTFTQGFAEGLQVSGKIISPTFTLIREYPLPSQPQAKLYHIYLYRLESPKDIEQLGIREIFDNRHNIVLIEWADKLGKILPPQAVRIYLKNLGQNTREIEIR